MLCVIMQDTRRPRPGEAPVYRAATPRSGAVWIAVGVQQQSPPAAGPPARSTFHLQCLNSISAGAGHPFVYRYGPKADAMREQPMKRVDNCPISAATGARPAMACHACARLSRVDVLVGFFAGALE